MKFNPGLKINQVINNNEIHDIFKCSTTGGMRTSKVTKTVTVVTDYTKSIYEDKYEGGILYYTGMGLRGDQTLEGNANRRVNESNENGYEIHWFEVFEPNQYTYRGVMKLVGAPFTKKQPDADGNDRKVYIFPLVKVENTQLIEEGMEEIHKVLFKESGKEKAEIVTIIESGFPNSSDKDKRVLKSKRKYKKKDYVEDAKKNTQIGMLGEYMILEYEKKRLEKLGRSDLAEKIERVSEKDDSVGFDIISYDINENGDEYEIFIEVKTTKSDKESIFYISKNEMKVLEDLKETYYIYRVFEAESRKPMFYKIKGLDIFHKFDLTPQNFIVKLKEAR